MRFALATAVLFGAGWALADINKPLVGEPAIRLPDLVAAGRLADLRWPDFSNSCAEVAKFYESRDYALAWTHDSAPTAQARTIIGIMQNAGAKGLDFEDYDGSRWSARLARLRPLSPQPTQSDLIRFDLTLTVSAMRYISDTTIGKVNPKVCFGFDVDYRQCDLVAALRRLVNANDVPSSLEQLEPPFPGYRRTEQALQRYRALAREDDGETLRATSKPVEPGDSYASVARLERLLHRLGDLSPGAVQTSDSVVYRGQLVDAVKHFQARHGLDPDGRIGKTTLQQLNTPLSRRVRQLELALERWRWIPNELRRPPIVVNIPEFRLRALNDHYEAMLEMKVVVGSAYRRQTPVFTNNITHIIFRPYWNVPRSIQRGELIPQLRKDPAYLAKNDYEIRDSRGELVPSENLTEDVLAQLSSGKLSIRQIPGQKNALGHIKFMFPNEHNVYLHGTPTQALFSKSRRDFSHGCIRVEKPEELAVWVLKDQHGWTLDRIQKEEKGVKPLQVNLDKSIPVLIVYSTAVVGENGEVSFFQDIYQHDATLEELLDRGYPYSDRKLTTAPGGRRPLQRN